MKKSTNTCLFKDPKYKYMDNHANSQNGKHKHNKFWVFGVLNTPKLWYPNIFVPQFFLAQIFSDPPKKFKHKIFSARKKGYDPKTF